MSHRRSIDVDTLARVEGEGALHVAITDGRVEQVRLRIYEPPRLFEGLLRGRGHLEPPDITARICGICPVAYQVSAAQAIEDACGVDVGAGITALRRLLYCGEWIESHVLHIYLLHAPDFVGYDGVVDMARDHPGEVERGLALRRAGTHLVEVVGGRATHPVNFRVGGFHRAPARPDLLALRDELLRARDAALDTVAWVSGFEIPDLELDVRMLALRHPDHYPIEAGRLATSGGVDLPVSAFDELVVEEQVPHSTALHARLRDGHTYLTGPLARFALNAQRLSPLAAEAAAGAGLAAPCTNPFRSIVVRAVEVVHALDEALRLIGTYQPPVPATVPVPPRAATGHAASEAPRGLLYHRYTLDDDGTVVDGRIVPPTSQNQRAIERDLERFVAANLDLTDDDLQWRCEQVIRNHDPCISCAAHFLTLSVDRR